MVDASGDGQLQLCFNRSHFQRSDFNVERFVNLARKRATLNQIQNDLRIHLRQLQNSMIELINDDYADFVNLSSSLAALRESVDKVSSDIQLNWSSFFASVAELENCSDTIEKNLTELANCRRQQTLHRDKLSLLQSIQNLHNFINKIDSKKARNANWYAKMALLVSAVEFWSKRTNFAELPLLLDAKNKCLDRIRDLLLGILTDELSGNDTKNDNADLTILVTLLQLIGEVENAVSHVVNEIIAKSIKLQEFGDGKHQLNTLLGNVLDQIFRLRKQWVQRAKRKRQLIRDFAYFVDNCLLTFLISFIERRFSTVLIPTDARLFHACYHQITDFVTNWPVRSSAQLSLFQSLRDKFNLVVYFKLASQPLLAPLRDLSEQTTFISDIINGVEESAYSCLSQYSNSLISCLNSLYSTEVFIPSLADKFWEFTLQRMDAYLNWIDGLVSYFSHNFTRSESVDDEKSSQHNASQPTKQTSPNNTTSPASQPSDWFLLPLTALYRDLQLFDSALFQFCLDTVWTLLRELRIDTTPFGQCLSRFSEQIGQKQKEIVQTLKEQLGKELEKKLSAVSEIPRQYRWTKRPSPICFSGYLNTAFGVCETFMEEAQKFGWKNEEKKSVLSTAMDQSVNGFCERAEKVLESVEQTGSSLLRFKQRKAITAGGGNSSQETETDEAKIRAQIRFDANLVRQRAVEYGISETGRLEQIEQRAATNE